MKKTHLFFILTLLFALPLAAQNPKPKTQGQLKELFSGPSSPENRQAWLNELRQWRTEERKRLQFSDSEYLRPQFGWLKKSFVYVQMMAHERYFYDPVAGKYTVDRYLDDLQKRYGGIDAVLIWPTYPNIGIDNRNQFDLLAAMPGGIDAVRQMILDFKKRGVRVFFPIMIWDRGTRPIDLPMAVALMKEMKEIGADGMNGDTMNGVTEDFRNAYDSLGYPVLLQPEISMHDLKLVEWNLSSWGYYWNFTPVPGVSIYKWLEPRHQPFETNRWEIDKTNDLQYAFFNGVGYNPWENIWGIWNQVPERYAEAIRRIATIYRQFPGIWNSADWEPAVPVLQSGVFASAFPGVDQTVYTFINRDSADKNGQQIRLPYREGMKYFDLWHGTELQPAVQGDEATLSFSMESRGFGALLAIRDFMTNENLATFLGAMRDYAKRPLNSFSDGWKPLPQQLVAIEKTRPAAKAPSGMRLIPATSNYQFESNGVMIEGDRLPTAVGVQHPWEEHPSRSQKHSMDIPAFYMDIYPVTNRDFKKFMDAAHYEPKDKYNFLKDWVNGTYPAGWANKPVTWVSLEDARAYAAWAGKRLPHEWEWQYAAQGSDNRLYPWGDKMDPARMPAPDSSRTMRPLTDVNAFPGGASPFGIKDMVGNIWQWTDEYDDDHTRNAILKGGGYYRSTTSKWYFPRAFELNKYGKYLLMAPSIDRSGTIGFRCVVDK
ncbi:MAG TPA: SUMF1/EgtB/PvdO family nonheme iron enzyme [Puia sp.]|nr:SUMF1/EgtB/PvdO family nonheme iron enzyme [Puia sp.]